MNTSPKIGRNEPCPCGGGKKTKRCHEELVGRPRADAFANPNCYARELGHCDTKISREHVVPRVIIERFTDLSIQGFPWMKTADPERFAPNALAARVLCKRHNETLSGLDRELGAFFEAMHSLQVPGTAAPLVVDGAKLERSLVKILCGGLAADLFRRTGEFEKPGRRPPRSWVEVLYGNRSVRAPAGLYIGLGDQEMTTNRSFVLRARFGQDALPWGIMTMFSGIAFLLALGPLPPAERPRWQWRPGRLGGSERCIDFRWPDDGERHVSIILTNNGSRTGVPELYKWTRREFEAHLARKPAS